jgi:hypothetical protein
MDRVEFIIKNHMHNQPEAVRARAKRELLLFLMKLLEFEQVGDYGIAGMKVFLSKSMKRSVRVRMLDW